MITKPAQKGQGMAAFERTTKGWPKERRESLLAWAAERNIPISQPYILLVISMWNIEETSRLVHKRITEAIKRQSELQSRTERRFFLALIAVGICFVLSSYFGATIAYSHGYSAGKADGINQLLTQFSKTPR